MTGGTLGNVAEGAAGIVTGGSLTCGLLDVRRPAPDGSTSPILIVGNGPIIAGTVGSKFETSGAPGSAVF